MRISKHVKSPQELRVNNPAHECFKAVAEKNTSKAHRFCNLDGNIFVQIVVQLYKCLV